MMISSSRTYWLVRTPNNCLDLISSTDWSIYVTKDPTHGGEQLVNGATRLKENREDAALSIVL